VGRADHAMAYDSARGHVVLFGGSSTYLLGDAWEYGCTFTFYLDADGDGDGNPNVTVRACSAPAGYVANGSDCDDLDASVYADAPQLCDGKNDDCLDPTWPTVPANEADADADGYRICAGDCDDSNANVHPDAPEVCDGIDDNCNGQVDEDTQGVDTDGDGVHNACDRCPDTLAGEVVNVVGCSISQLVPSSWPWKNHGEYVSAVAEVAGEFVTEGLITEAQGGAIVSAAARSDVGKRR
jgi:hypothetical protein